MTTQIIKVPNGYVKVNPIEQIQEGDWYLDTQIFFANNSKEAHAAETSPNKRGKIIETFGFSLENIPCKETL